MRIVIINLASHEARWFAASLQFEQAGLQAERLEAVPGEALSADERDSLYCGALNRQQFHKALQPGEIGCYASHIAAWRRLVASGLPAMAVFEDDIEIDADLPRVLAALARGSPQWDIVKLIGRPTERARTSRPLMAGRALIGYRRIPSLTGAYVITRRGAEKLLARRLPFGRPVDVDLRHWWECDLEVLGVQPYPVRGAPSSRTSTIGDRSIAGERPRRVAKLLLQARYSLLNWAARRFAGIAAPPALQPAPSRHWQAGRDAG